MLCQGRGFSSSSSGWIMTQARILSHVMRWLVAVLAILAAAEVAAGAEVKGRVVDPEGQQVKSAC